MSAVIAYNGTEALYQQLHCLSVHCAVFIPALKMQDDGMFLE